MKTEQERAMVDWRLTTWEGARREQLRRWAGLPLESIILALEEMEELARWFSQTPQADKGAAVNGSDSAGRVLSSQGT